MKNHRDALIPDDENVNMKMWSVCDLALGIITTRTTNFERKDYLSDARIPSMYFKPHEDPNFLNLVSYLPTELQHSQPKKASAMGAPIITVTDKTVVNSEGKENENTEEVTNENGDEAVTVGKRTRSAANGGPDAKRTKV